MTLLEAIQRSTEFLARKGVDSPRLQAELLLAHGLRMPRMQLYLKFDQALQPQEQEACRELVKRRGAREPLQQILGSTSFCGFEIQLDRHVLVPRPETELLAEQGWLFLQELAAKDPSVSLQALDFGTGSGCLAIALAARCPQCRVTGVDAAPEALAVAAKNVEALGLEARVQLVQASGLSALESGAAFHLLISNPPYIPSGEIEHLQPEVRDFEPRSALDGGPDGLNFYRQLAAEARARLLPQGKGMFEFGDGQAESIRRIFEEQNWIVERVIEDYTRRPRLLIVSNHG